MEPIVFEASSSYGIKGKGGLLFADGDKIPAGTILLAAQDRGRGDYWLSPTPADGVLVRRRTGCPDFCSVWAVVSVAP